MIWWGGGEEKKQLRVNTVHTLIKLQNRLRNRTAVVLEQNKIKRLIHMEYYEYGNRKSISTSRDTLCTYKQKTHALYFVNKSLILCTYCLTEHIYQQAESTKILIAAFCLATADTTHFAKLSAMLMYDCDHRQINISCYTGILAPYTTVLHSTFKKIL